MSQPTEGGASSSSTSSDSAKKRVAPKLVKQGNKLVAVWQEEDGSAVKKDNNSSGSKGSKKFNPLLGMYGFNGSSIASINSTSNSSASGSNSSASGSAASASATSSVAGTRGLKNNKTTGSTTALPGPHRASDQHLISRPQVPSVPSVSAVTPLTEMQQTPEIRRQEADNFFSSGKRQTSKDTILSEHTILMHGSSTTDIETPTMSKAGSKATILGNSGTNVPNSVATSKDTILASRTRLVQSNHNNYQRSSQVVETPGSTHSKESVKTIVSEETDLGIALYDNLAVPSIAQKILEAKKGRFVAHGTNSSAGSSSARGNNNNSIPSGKETIEQNDEEDEAELEDTSVESVINKFQRVSQFEARLEAEFAAELSESANSAATLQRNFHPGTMENMGTLRNLSTRNNNSSNALGLGPASSHSNPNDLDNFIPASRRKSVFDSYQSVKQSYSSGDREKTGTLGLQRPMYYDGMLRAETPDDSGREFPYFF